MYDVTKVYMIFREMYCLPIIDMILREKVGCNGSFYDFPRKLIWYNEKRPDLTKNDMILREMYCLPIIDMI